MLRTRHILLIFIPALVVAAFGLFIKILQYEPIVPKNAREETATAFRVPIYADDPILGDKKAAATVVAFGDYGCNDCREQDAILAALLKKHPSRVKVIWKGVPVTHFPQDTTLAHVYAYCAKKQKKFDAFKEYAFLNGDSLTETTLKSIAEKITLDEKTTAKCLEAGEGDAFVKNAEQVAQALNIQSLPAIFVDNAQIPTPNSVEEWESVLHLN